MKRLAEGRFFGSTLSTRRTGGLVLVDSLHRAGSRLPRHRHERAYFCLNRSGTYTEDYGRRRRICHAGMLVFHPPGEVHQERHDTPVRSFNVELGHEWLGLVFDIAGPLDQPAELVNDAVATLAAGVHPVHFAAAFRRVYGSSAGEYVRRRRFEYARRRLADPALTLAEVAADAGFADQSHFTRVFRRFTGMTRGRYRTLLSFKTH